MKGKGSIVQFLTTAVVPQVIPVPWKSAIVGDLNRGVRLLAITFHPTHGYDTSPASTAGASLNEAP